MSRVFKDEVATVIVHGTVNQETLKKATERFLKGVVNEQKKNEKHNLKNNSGSNGGSVSCISFRT